jgi:hypothetical protein
MRIADVIKWLFWKCKKEPWIYGSCNGTFARKHRKKGNVQFILWKAGEQGHKQDYWHDFGAGWENQFKANF